jgi:hypothetical protein
MKEEIVSQGLTSSLGMYQYMLDEVISSPKREGQVILCPN